MAGAFKNNVKLIAKLHKKGGNRTGSRCVKIVVKR